MKRNNDEETVEYTEIAMDEPSLSETSDKNSACIGDKNATAQRDGKKRRRRFGDRKDGRKLRTIPPMLKFTPYIMPHRNDACNYFNDIIEISNAEKLCRQKIKEGKKNFTMLHVMLAAYVRALSQRPALNRFVSGQKIFARNEIVIAMDVKRQMTLESEDTCIKVVFDPADTIDVVYEKFTRALEEASAEDDNSSFEKVNRTMNRIPGLLLRLTMKFLSFLDYFGWLPKKLLNVSPFHASMFITSLGSLGIKPVYHHIYNFGNIPVFLAYGMKRSMLVLDDEGNVVKKRIIDFKATTDERICDGYYFASAFKLLKKYIENPEQLQTPPSEVFEDVE